ncbi:MAG TPA: CRISPR-associated endonuclease Cas1 [Armatimonadota bacterium]|nr:CRISPR-associated endonuclease Cas1 [Armatimonadota bacterium]
MISLYVRENGALVRRSRSRLIIARGETVLHTARLREVERVVLAGNVELTASAASALLEQGIETVFLSPGGRYRGRLAPAEGKNVFLRRAQFRAADLPEFRLEVSRAIVLAKCRSSRVVVRRYLERHEDQSLERVLAALGAARERVGRATSLPELLGCEGDAARIYFGGLGRMVREPFVFTTRTRRPPKDPVNALLSFGYTLCTTEITGAVAGAGLDPHVGYYHELDYGRPSLALDLLEEFRQPVIDRLALSLCNRSVLQPADFEARDQGVLLTDRGRQRFLAYYHRALETEFVERTSGERGTYRTFFRRQADRIRRAVEAGDASLYVPFQLD